MERMTPETKAAAEIASALAADMPGLTFDEKVHRYTLNGARLPSVTEVMRPLSEAWYGGVDEAVLSHAARRGTGVHQAIENFLLFGVEDVPPEHRGYFDAYQRWRREWSPQIMSTLFDNKILMEADPSYLANLKALSFVERERLLHGNWKIKPAAGLFFRRSQIGNMLSVIPDDVQTWVRAWDLAATADSESGDAAFTSGVLMGKRKDGRYVIADVINVRQSAHDVRQTVKLTAQADRARFKRVRIRLPQDPGQAGKAQAQSYIRLLSGFDVCAVPESGSKEVRAEPMAAQWQAGNFDVLTADWNEPYFNQLESFPASKYKDMVDAGSAAFAELELRGIIDIKALNS